MGILIWEVSPDNTQLRVSLPIPLFYILLYLLPIVVDSTYYRFVLLHTNMSHYHCTWLRLILLTIQIPLNWDSLLVSFEGPIVHLTLHCANVGWWQYGRQEEVILVCCQFLTNFFQLILNILGYLSCLNTLLFIGMYIAQAGSYIQCDRWRG